jgi:glucose/mannose-6-phosphate isomerase
MKTILDRPILARTLDRSGMLTALDHFPDPLKAHDNLIKHESKTTKSGFRNILLMGMGGSASSADVALDWLRDYLNVPAVVHREPVLPTFVNSRTLSIGISYSGETSETLAAFRAAKARGSNLVGIGTGGKLESLCGRFRAPFIHVEESVAPRAALSQLVVAISVALERAGAIPSVSHELRDARRELLTVKRESGFETPLVKNPAKRLASRFLGRFIVLYSLQRMSSIARRFKNQLAENSKEVAKFDLIPESCHNEIEAWSNSPVRSLPIMIRESGESEFEHSIIEAFRSTIGAASRTKPIDVEVPCRGRLSRLLCPILFLDYVSVYLALLKGIDPTPTKLITKYKRAIGS